MRKVMSRPWLTASPHQRNLAMRCSQLTSWMVWQGKHTVQFCLYLTQISRISDTFRTNMACWKADRRAGQGNFTQEKSCGKACVPYLSCTNLFSCSHWCCWITHTSIFPPLQEPQSSVGGTGVAAGPNMNDVAMDEEQAPVNENAEAFPKLSYSPQETNSRPPSATAKKLPSTPLFSFEWGLVVGV